MLGQTNPGNGRLALTLLDALIRKLMAQGLITQADVDVMTAEAASRLEAENSITSWGGIATLETSQIGQ